jgi:hypothetical protein
MPTGFYKRTKKRGGWTIKDTSKMNLDKIGMKFSDDHKKKLREVMIRKGIKPPVNKGKNCHFWRGGVAKPNDIVRHCLEYKLWRTAVFERDNYTCIWCGAKGGGYSGGRVILNADHIKPFAYYPELRFAIDNGRTLCVPCHKTTDTWGLNQYSKKDGNI